jgi:acetyl-CoA synthetase
MEQYFTVEEAAALMKVSTETVRRWLRTGTVQGLKHGRDWRIPESALCTCGCEKCSDREGHQPLTVERPKTTPDESAGAHQSRTVSSKGSPANPPGTAEASPSLPSK